MKHPRRIVVIGLSNVGDAILMSPVIERLRTAYPDSELSLYVGERAQPLFEHDPRITRLQTFERFDGPLGRLKLAGDVLGAKPDLLIDLRRTILPMLWRPWRAWRYLHLRRPGGHMRDRHLAALRRQAPGLTEPRLTGSRPGLWASQDAARAVERLLARWNIDPAKPLVVMAPGSRSHIKRWHAARYAALADRLIADQGIEVVLTGEPDESPIIDEVLGAMDRRAHSAVGSTTILQAAALMRRAALVITNDSAALHAACAVGAPVLAIFGPTDPTKYGPTGQQDRVIRRQLVCSPCEKALCRYNHECMRFISVDEVYQSACELISRGVR